MATMRSIAHTGGCACIRICLDELDVDTGQPVATRDKCRVTCPVINWSIAPPFLNAHTTACVMYICIILTLESDFIILIKYSV